MNTAGVTGDTVIFNCSYFTNFTTEDIFWRRYEGADDVDVGSHLIYIPGVGSSPFFYEPGYIVVGDTNMGIVNTTASDSKDAEGDDIFYSCNLLYGDIEILSRLIVLGKYELQLNEFTKLLLCCIHP